MAKQQSTPKSPVQNPLDDDDFSDLTKKEILYWSRQLEISPSQLFLLPKDELNKRMEQQCKKSDEERQKYYERWEHMTSMKQKLIENQQNKRLKGGAGRNIYDILAEAANQIEEMYGDASYYDQSAYNSQEYDDSTMASRTYNTSNSCPFREDLTYTLSDEEPTFESTFEDSFAINPNLASTPRCPRAAPNSATFNVPTNATYQVAPNQTYNRTQHATNNTFTTRQCPMNTTYNAHQCPMNEKSYKLPPAGLNESSRQSAQQWSPQSMAFMDNSRDKSRSTHLNSFEAGVGLSSTMNQTFNAAAPSIRNFTDYSVVYSPQGTEESANSVSIENYDENSGVIRASSRNYTLPSGSKAGNTTLDIPAAVMASMGNKTFDIPSSVMPGSGRISKSPTRCPVTKAPPPQCPLNQTAEQTPARTPINPRTYKPRKLDF
ncbi:uncharacterized protein [Musca autumnalis]|uniref:uncharacterized protein n=1 Tax=Musca autumnalis TaxID=221902 RepID=UPI003CF035EB